MIKTLRHVFALWPLPLACVINAGCQPGNFTKEQQVLSEAARYACYGVAGQKASDALRSACPEFSEYTSCPAVDLIVEVLEKDLEACDAE